MDMKLFKQHLANITTLKESASQSSAHNLAQKLDEFERASKNLLSAWDEAISTINDDNVTHTASYPFEESFDDVVSDISKFVKSFKNKLRTVR